MADLDGIERVEPARGVRPGWRVTVHRPGPPGRARAPETQFFGDTTHGSPGAALDAALAWRDEAAERLRRTAPKVFRQVRDDAENALLPGIHLQRSRHGDRTYLSVRTSVQTPEGQQRAFRRSIGRRSAEDALRDVARFRFEHMRRLHGDAFPYASADDLYREALAALRTSPLAREAGLPDSPGG